MFLIHLHVHHLQERPHFFEVHFPVFVFVGLVKPVSDPPDRMLRETRIGTDELGFMSLK